MKKLAVLLMLFTCGSAFGQCQPGVNCTGDCNICTVGTDGDGNGYYYCDGAPGGGVGFVCRVVSRSYCVERVPICNAQGKNINPDRWFDNADKQALYRRAAKVQNCAQTSVADDHQQMIDQNQAWMAKKGLGAELGGTYQGAIFALEDAILHNGIVGTKEAPAYYRGYILNDHSQVKFLALNIKPGVWEITAEKPAFGEKDFPAKIVVSKTGVVAKYH